MVPSYRTLDKRAGFVDDQGGLVGLPNFNVSSLVVVTMRAARPILMLAFLFNVLLGTTLHQSVCVHWSVASSRDSVSSAEGGQADSAALSTHRTQKCDDPGCLFHRHEDEKATPVPAPEPAQDSNGGPTHHRAKCSVCQTLLLTALPTDAHAIEQLVRAEQIRILDHLRFYRPDSVLGFSTRGPPLA